MCHFHPFSMAMLNYQGISISMVLRTIHLGIVYTTYGDDWGMVQMALFYPQKNHFFTGSSMKIHIFLWVFHWHPAIGAPLTHENSMCFSGGFSPSTAAGFPKHPPLSFGSFWDYADSTNDVQRAVCFWKTMGKPWENGDLMVINPWLIHY